MRTINLILALFLALTLLSCNHAKRETEENLEIMGTIPLNLGSPTSMKIYKNYAFLVDMMEGEDHIISVYDIQKKDFLFSFGDRGQGPHDYLYVSDVNVFEDSQGAKVYVYDPMSFKVGVYDFDSLMIQQSKYMPRVTTREKDKSYHGLWRVKNGYIATGRIENNKYTLFSDSLTPIADFGNYRPKPIESIPMIQHIAANYGNSIVDEDGTSFIEILYNAPILSLYELSGNQFRKKWEHVIKELYYKTRGSGVEDITMGYLSACFGGENIYALYCGKPKDMNASATYANKIHVYNRNDGHIISRYTLPVPSFLCSTDGEKLYVLSHEPEPMITIYKLP